MFSLDFELGGAYLANVGVVDESYFGFLVPLVLELDEGGRGGGEV